MLPMGLRSTDITASLCLCPRNIHTAPLSLFVAAVSLVEDFLDVEEEESLGNDNLKSHHIDRKSVV